MSERVPPESSTPHMAQKALLTCLERWVDVGHLRPLDSAFAAFIAEVAPDTSATALLILALLAHMEGQGHSCLDLDVLRRDPQSLLAWSETISAEWAPDWRETNWINPIRDCMAVQFLASEASPKPLILEDHRLYLRRYWQDEEIVANAVRARVAHHTPVSAEGIREWLDRLFVPSTSTNPDWQKIACAVALRAPLTVITGGPGTGKTYTAARLLALIFALAAQTADAPPLRVALAAPTGKAAARLKQSIDTALGELDERLAGHLDIRTLVGHIGAARTLHSLLGARPDTRRFAYNAARPLDVDVLIVDEASMVHLEMMSALLQALPAHARLILLGDKDQLASVEAGAVLGDLCRNAEAGHYKPETQGWVHRSTGEIIPDAFISSGSLLSQQIVMLRESRRFSGPIGQLALAVNAGDITQIKNLLSTEQECAVLWYPFATSAEVIQRALGDRQQGKPSYKHYLKRIAQYRRKGSEAEHLQWIQSVLKDFEAFRLLCAVRAGEWGVEGINHAVEEALQKARIIQKTGEWYVGRPVLITRNDYSLGVFNGDIGIALPAWEKPYGLRVYLQDGDQTRSVLPSRLPDVQTAFAMTVHKSQGSEFQHTMLVLPDQDNPVLTRELIYTGITRARSYFTLALPSPQVLEQGLARTTRRMSGLQGKLNT